MVKINIIFINIAQKLIDSGAEEILINSIDNDGSLLGYDINLAKEFTKIGVSNRLGGGGMSHM